MSAPRRAILRLAGPEIPQEEVIVTEEGMTIGRLEANDLTLKHTKISRQHTFFRLTDKGLTVEDLGSSNGTFVGETRLEPNDPLLLNPGDSVQVGPFTLFFERIAEAEAPKPSKKQDKPAKAESKEPPPKKSTSKAKKTEAPPPPQPTSPPPPPPAPPESGARAVSSNGGPPPEHLIGIPQDVSSWVQYLPAVFSEDEFLKRFLLIFEAIHAPHEWIVDNFDCYLDPDLTPPEWLRWFGSWCDILIPGTIPLERQRAVGRELGPLFLARGTRRSLTRHLELVFGVEPNIEEPPDRDATFVVRLPLGKDNDTLANRDVADQIINAQRPVHTNYELHIT